MCPHSLFIRRQTSRLDQVEVVAEAEAEAEEKDAHRTKQDKAHTTHIVAAAALLALSLSLNPEAGWSPIVSSSSASDVDCS